MSLIPLTIIQKFILENTHTHHVCQSDVEEHSTGKCEDPVGGEAVPGQDAEAHPQVAAAGRQEVEEQGLLDAHPSVQQDDKVS